jgi:PhnB protein
MKQLNIPQGYNQLMPYLIIKDAAGFMQFMKDVFGAEEIIRHMRSEDIIVHAEIKIGDCVVMFADATGDYEPRTGGFFIYVAAADDVYKTAIEAGAAAISPVSDQPYGRSGGVIDPYGNTWWITTSV